MLTKERKLQLLKEWKAAYDKLNAQSEAMQAVVGDGFIDGPLFNAMWRVFELYTDGLSREIGDPHKFLSWHCYENEWGARGKGKKPLFVEVAGKRHYVRNLSDLLQAIELVGGAA